MKYDFDTIVERRNTNSHKWDVKEGELPMWVADMDFQTAPEIREALQRRLEHGIFGYENLPDRWYEAYIFWWKKRHGFQIEKDWLIFSTGVVPSISSAVRKLTTPAEKVLIQTPVYNIFFHSIINNGRYVIESPLVYDGEAYRIDFSDLEQKLSDPQTTLMILCNPQNPVGKIWDKETLARIGALCYKHHVTVVSDEIHCDLVAPGLAYTPFAAASDICREISVTCIAPTKTFSIPGLQTSAVFAVNEVLRHKMWRGLNTDEVAEPNSFAVEATVAAYTKGEPWLEALRAYIQANKMRVVEFLAKELPDIHVVSTDATYLLWLDCGKVTKNSLELRDYIRQTTGLFMSDGLEYGQCGAAFLRLNVACQRAKVEDGLLRLKKGVYSYLHRDIRDEVAWK